LGFDRASLPCRRSKAGKFEDRYENAFVELLNQEAQARAGTNGREPRDTGNVVNLTDALARA
jgi:non-homologous end joining protein Ku